MEMVATDKTPVKWLRVERKASGKTAGRADMLLRTPDIWADRQVSPTVFDLWQGGAAAPPVCFWGNG
jgi:hypothetical protein